LQLFACFAVISHCERSKNAAGYGFLSEPALGLSLAPRATTFFNLESKFHRQEPVGEYRPGDLVPVCRLATSVRRVVMTGFEIPCLEAGDPAAWTRR
jgi:hypothetical protein